MIVETQKPGCFEDYKAILNAIYQLAGGQTAVDLGCGEAHVTKHWNCVYVDSVIRPTSPGKTIQMDMRDAPSHLQIFRYDLMVMSDSLEHLTKFDGLRLLEGMDQICRARFVFTPLGPYHMDPTATHPDAHKSAWFPKEFEDMSWEVLSYPRYHIFSGGEVLGAFFAWDFHDSINPTADQVLKLAGVALQ